MDKHLQFRYCGLWRQFSGSFSFSVKKSHDGLHLIPNNHFNRSLCLCLIVERAKKCLDFTATFYIFHLFSCIWYNQQFPRSWQWWILTILAASIMTTIGEQLCMYVELQDIKIDVRFWFFIYSLTKWIVGFDSCSCVLYFMYRMTFSSHVQDVFQKFLIPSPTSLHRHHNKKSTPMMSSKDRRISCDRSCSPSKIELAPLKKMDKRKRSDGTPEVRIKIGEL